MLKKLKRAAELWAEYGPSDSDEWCEYGGGCPEDPDDCSDECPQCKYCAAYYELQNLMIEFENTKKL